MSTPSAEHTLVLLEQLTLRMQACQMWSETPPSQEALRSQAPFACDTMAFEQWLQFIFVPRLTHLIEQRQPLPARMRLMPMAEEVWRDTSGTEPVEQVLAQFDMLFGAD